MHQWNWLEEYCKYQANKPSASLKLRGTSFTAVEPPWLHFPGWPRPMANNQGGGATTKRS